MNYTIQGGGTTIKFHQEIINSTSVQGLRSSPLNLISQMPTLAFGLIPIVCIFALDVTTSTSSPLLIGNSQLCNSYTNQELGVWSSFDMQNSEPGGLNMNFVLQQANNRDFQLANAERNYNPSGISPGTNTFELFQLANDAGANYGGLFSIYYIDGPLY